MSQSDYRELENEEWEYWCGSTVRHFQLPISFIKDDNGRLSLVCKCSEFKLETATETLIFVIVALVDKDCTSNTVLFLKIKLKYAFVLKVSERKAQHIFYAFAPRLHVYFTSKQVVSCSWLKPKKVNSQMLKLLILVLKCGCFVFYSSHVMFKKTLCSLLHWYTLLCTDALAVQNSQEHTWYSLELYLPVYETEFHNKTAS